MADPRAIIPYDDPFDSLYTESFFSFLDNSIPNFADLSSPPQPNSYPPPISQSGDDNIDGAFDPSDDPILWGLYAGEAGPSESNQEEGNDQAPNFGHGNTMPLSFWPVPPVPFVCSCCHVLREIIHTNGNHIVKLEIHGTLGMICHAVLGNRRNTDAVYRGYGYQMFDFCKKSMEYVKQFLMHYCKERKQAGYIMLQDPLSIFYEALCVGLEWNGNLNTDEFFEQPPRDSGWCILLIGEHETNQKGVEIHEERIPKSSLAAQRERTGKLTLRDFVQYFHLPIEDAAKQLNICLTVVKKICRKHGLNRWPYRKIKSIEKKLTMLRVSLNTTNVEQRAHVQAEIDRLQQEMGNICAGILQ
ncbi:hypothetical protein L1049_007570 [Liquidambar formosana]|uniref:RWP-RK domain-containing protein n=1 Tax=Liquidambar formosana TaxID=63359 RepID=A0AAP0S8D9_LIQFO